MARASAVDCTPGNGRESRKSVQKCPAARRTESIAPESRKRCFATLSRTASVPLLGLSACWPQGFGMDMGRSYGTHRHLPECSAAVPHVTFPAEPLAAARVFGIMIDYLRVGEGLLGSCGVFWVHCLHGGRTSQRPGMGHGWRVQTNMTCLYKHCCDGTYILQHTCCATTVFIYMYVLYIV
jgi:hypothetical protein